jgi:hypothetical protein
MNTQGARMVYNNAIRSVMKAFGLPSPSAVLKNFKLTQSSLRLELPYVIGNNQYNFNVLVNQAQPAINNTEVRLNLQDSFVLSSLGFFSGLPSSAVDNTFKLDTYLNTTKYGAADALAMQVIYNSTLQLSVNRNVLIPNWDMWKHWYVPQTQQTVSPLVAGDDDSQYRGAEDGFYPVEPNITLIGSKNTQIGLNINGPGISAIAANSRVILLLRGVLVQNSTVVS